MSLRLSYRDEQMLQGAHGPAPQMAMRIVVRMAEVYGAPELMDIEAAHIDSTIYIGEAGLEFAERLASLGAKVSVPSTLNVSGLDEEHWMDWPVPEGWAEKAHRQMVAYRSMGTVQTWTCAPYQTEHRPKFGQQIAWGESNAISFANSVIGARTERYPDMLDICCAITGRVPKQGLHLEENRGGEVLVRLDRVPLALQESDEFYPVLGYLVGDLARDRIPVVIGLQHTPSEDQFKAFSAAVSTSGMVAMFHVVGHTPEAPTLEAALRGREPVESHEVGMEDLRAARRQLSTDEGGAVDMVLLGSPHFSLAEFEALVPLLKGRKKADDVRFLVTTSRFVRMALEHKGLLDELERFGTQLTVDTCPLATPMLPPDVRTLMTNSGKYAYYSPSLLGVRTVFGSTRDCVESAVSGRVTRDGSLWE
ncbi:MAG TPA: aconitase X catalytic domain-containing protein [Fimbriimonadaceae bacterium]|nr:aconitase X catalytic domain-containing protein [Fimbriimonadaceae bacterium]